MLLLLWEDRSTDWGKGERVDVMHTVNEDLTVGAANSFVLGVGISSGNLLRRD